MYNQHNYNLFIMTQQKILKELSNKGFIDYKLLAQPKNFSEYPKLLDSLLKQSEASFNKILKLKPDQINFKNVVETYFTHDRNLGILYGFIDSFDSTNNTDQTRKIIETFQPKLVDYNFKTSLNKNFYLLLKKVNKQKLDAEQKRSVELLLRNMKIAGISLPDAKRKILKKIDQDLSKISQKFRNNIIDSKKQFFYEFKNSAGLEEMPKTELEAAKMEAKQRKSKAEYVFTLSPPSIQAILKYCSDRSIREIFYKKNLTTASEGKYDNRPLVLKILQLRQKKANLLGCKNYADYILQERMAESTKQILTLLNKIGTKAKKKARNEINELSAFAKLKKLEEWDVPYYSEKLKQQKFQIEAKELKKYFPLNSVTKGLFQIMGILFGFEMKKLNTQSYYPDVQVFEMRKKGELLAYYVADFTARSTKKNGAWCNQLRAGFIGDNGTYEVPIIINVMNFPDANGKEPALLSHRDVETIFHEFGHAVHAIFSSKTYANLNGFSTEWDFVEFPSQILENWCWEIPALELFAKHYQTGKNIPPAMIQKLRNSKSFMSCSAVLRQLEFGLLDLNLHTNKVPTSVKKLDEFCTKIVQQNSILTKFKGYSMYTGFDHIFAGGYAAGYYSYIWAEILEADVFQKMKKDGILKPKTGQYYLEKVLEPGAKKPGMAIFKDYMGRNPDVQAFIQKHRLE